MEATVLRPNEGERIGGPTTVTIKATGEETGGSFYLGEVVAGVDRGAWRSSRDYVPFARALARSRSRSTSSTPRLGRGPR